MSSVDELLQYKRIFDEKGMPFSVEDAVAAGFEDSVIDEALFPTSEGQKYLMEERTTVRGKPAFEDMRTGDFYSEVTEVVPIGDGFMAMPTINPETGEDYDRAYLENWYLSNGNVDPYSGEKLPVFGSEEEAQKYAKWRSENQFNPELLDDNYWSRESGLPFPNEADAELSADPQSYRDKTRNAMADALDGTLGLDTYTANKIARRFVGNEDSSIDDGGIALSDFTPLGMAFGAQEAYRGYQNAKYRGDKLGMGLAVGEGALSIAEAVPGGIVASKIARTGAKTLYDLAKRIEIDPNSVGMNGGNIRFKNVDTKAMNEVEATPEAATTLIEEATNQVVPGQPPKKTITAFRIYDVVPGTGVRAKNPHNNPPTVGRPLFVNKNDHFEEGQWYDAKFGEIDPETGKVKASLSGGVAPRPGFHSAETPMSTHLGGMAIKGKKSVNYRKATEVWARVELPDDVPWQEEANRRMTTLKDGSPDLSTAEITDQLPVGGNYKYKTNPNMTGSWIISGSVKIDKFLSPDEAKAIAKEMGVEDLPLLPELIEREGLVMDDLTKSAQEELKRYYPDKYDELVNGVKAVTDSTPDAGPAQAVLDIRAAQMELATKDRIQPSGKDPLFDLSPESYEKTLPEQSETYVPRQPSGTNAPLPKGDRGRAVNESIEKISDRLAERMKPWLGTEAQYFYHTGPIVDKALSMGYTKEQVYEWMREFADAYAATSPRTETAQNIRNATLVMTKRHLGIDIDEIIGPGGGGINEKGYPMMIGDSGIHRQLTEATQNGGINPNTNPKPATFAENVYGNLDGVTVDTHAIRGALDAMNEINPGSIPIDYIKPKFRDQYKADPLSLNPATMIDDTMGSQMINGKKMQTEYAIFSDIYRRAAEKLGVSPAEAQSMGWFGSGDSTGLASELKSVARLLDERIDVTAQGLNKPKEEVFRMLLNKEIPLLQLFATAGGAGVIASSMGEEQPPELAKGGFLDKSEAEKGIMSAEGYDMAEEAFRLDRAKADLNGDGKLSKYEETRGEAVQKAIKNDDVMKANHGGMACGCEGECDGSCGGGMMSGSYYDVEMESGNPVPVGSLPEEVADDIPALLSDGEYVLPADVVRWHGLKHIQEMMIEAKAGLMSMDMMGQLHEASETEEEEAAESDSEDIENAEVSTEDDYTEEGQGELQEEYETPEGNDVEVATVETEEEVLEGEEDEEEEEAAVVSYAFKSTPKIAFIR